MNKLIVISGPSGVGKGTIVNELLKKGDYALSISCTTRPPRRGEKEGISYFFISREKFEAMIEEDGFLEYDNHFDNYYGTPKDFVQKQLQTKNVILEIEVNGALNAKRSYPEAILIMILPPNFEELKARLTGRGTESPEKIEKRLGRISYELSLKDKYDFAVVNDDLQRAVAEIENLIKSKQ
ncbi:MAG: guanylate kinase [Clostridia bacterium]|nr:guanylate kinase [Clostridia bacterium]